jgi:WhiB family redox-sensing transcriptional regulator
MSLDQEWQEFGACRGIPSEIFFPPVEHEAFEAKAVCARCSVRDHCLEFAIDAGERFGIWGGMTTQERRILAARRRREAAALATAPALSAPAALS